MTQFDIVDMKSINFNGVAKNGKKICSRCSLLLKIFKFGSDISNLGGKQIWCKKCCTEYARNYYAKSSGRTRDQIRKHGKTELSGKIINGRRLCSRCNKCVEVSCFRNSLCKECSKWYQRITQRMIKVEFLLAYGRVCRCCGEKEIDLLTIEHIRGKGHNLIYRGTTTALFWKLKALNWPEGYEILCWGCNMSTRDGRPCPHDTEEYGLYEQELESWLVNDGRKDKYYKLKYELLDKL